MPDGPQFGHAFSEPEVAMSAVKLDKDGNVVGEVEFNEVTMSPSFLAQIKEAAREGWAEGKATRRKEQ